MNNVLIVGSWAKEQVTIENIVRCPAAATAKPLKWKGNRQRKIFTGRDPIFCGTKNFCNSFHCLFPGETFLSVFTCA
ncbi:MAG: hypothetical protein GF333_06590 [Candidatus Omnitrophica bacterium]|nr:hypothetical protein [Candidatus Omnitrophota bacterium]